MTKIEKALALINTFATGDTEKAASLLAEGYIQHNLAYGTGRDAFVGSVAYLASAPVKTTVNNIRAFEDGDRVFLQTVYNFAGMDEQLGIDAKAVNDLIAQNARVAQNQTEYNERYEALVSRYEETERRRDELADRINQIMIRRRKLERFIETVEGLPELYTEFDAGQWAALVDSMTVHAKDRITFTLTCRMEIEA